MSTKVWLNHQMSKSFVRGHLTSRSQMLFHGPILIWLHQNHLGSIFKKERDHEMCIFKKLSRWFRCTVGFGNHLSRSAYTFPSAVSPPPSGISTFHFRDLNVRKFLPTHWVNTCLPVISAPRFCPLEPYKIIRVCFGYSVPLSYHVRLFKCLAPGPLCPSISPPQ